MFTHRLEKSAAARSAVMIVSLVAGMLLGPVEASAANRAPVISGKPATSVIAGNKYSFKPTASDPNGDALTFSIINRPAWASFSASTGRLYGTPGANQVGVYSDIRIRVSDGLLRVALPAFSIEVRPATTPPPSGNTLAKLLNFAETWDRNWNFGGHSVDSRFTADYAQGWMNSELRRFPKIGFAHPVAQARSARVTRAVANQDSHAGALASGSPDELGCVQEGAARGLRPVEPDEDPHGRW